MNKIIPFLLLLLTTSLHAAENRNRLLVGITVSHFYPEWLSVYRNELSEGGLLRLISRGRCMEADYNYQFSQTGVDHATIYTGLMPAVHGIVAHDWYDRLKNRRVNAVENSAYRLLDGEGAGLSPESLQVPTLGAVMKQCNAFSKVYSIGVNGEETVLSGGSAANLALWLDDKTGKWASSTFYAEELPAWVKDFNAGLENDFLLRRGWMPLEMEGSSSTAMKLKSKVGIGNGFFYDLQQARRRYHTYRILKATPYANSMVFDLAEELLKHENLGSDNDVDLLCLNLSSLDYMNRDFDVYSREFRDMLLRLDKDVEKFFNFLDGRVGKDSYSCFLTFAEARELLPEEWERMRIKAGYFSSFKAVALMKSFLNLLYGEGEWISDYDAMQVYLDRALFEKRKISLKEVQDKIANFMVEFEGVSRVLTAHSLSGGNASGTDVLVRNSFSQKRSGDILFALQPSWLASLKEREDNFTRYSKRHKVPVYLYGTGWPEVPEKGRMTDLLGILCRMAGVPLPYTAGL